MDRTPLTDLKYQKLAQSLQSDVTDQDLRTNILDKLKAAIGETDTLDQAKSADRCLGTGYKAFPKCLTVMSTYHQYLVSYLVGLACSDAWIARGVTLKADTDLATALLKVDCPAMKALPEVIKKRLEQIRWPTRESRGR